MKIALRKLNLICLLVLTVFTLGARGEAVCATKSLTTLRKGAGPQFEKSWVVTKYMPFIKLEQKNGWMKLADLDGDVHYGRSSDFTTQTRCVVVKSATAETHSAPDSKSPAGDFKTLDRFTPLKRLDAKGDWLEVETDVGTKAWIHQNHVWRPVQVQSVKF